MENPQIEIRRSSRRRTVQLEIKPDGAVLLRAPARMTDTEIGDFLARHRDWLEKHLRLAEERRAAQPESQPLTLEELHALAEAARADLPRRCACFAPLVGVSYGRITIRSQKTRWGSCSSKGNLNFNCLLMLAPEPVRDYVVVHELCHRLEMNHSPRFWSQVERVIPDYRQAKKWLKDNGNQLMRRIKAVNQ